MKEKIGPSLSLIAKILIIVLLPVVLFYYIDSKPAKLTTKDEDDEGTRKIAIVNEDNGFVINADEVELGKEISSLLSERDRYSWTVENRNGAEKKFAEEKYDGILYIPSNFTEQIMNFKSLSPLQAEVNYVVQPNLEAKERQRVHREISDIKSIVNKEMSSIYWSYISQEVDYIQKEFDNILEKEITFQEAIFAFYAPTSKKLSSEVETYKERLERIVDQTGTLDEAVADNISDVTDTEEQMEQLLQSFTAYRELQIEQQQLFDEMQGENRQKVDAGIDAYNESMQRFMGSIMTDIDEYETPEYAEEETIEGLSQGHKRIKRNVHFGQRQLNLLEHQLDESTFEDDVRNQLEKVNEKFLQQYYDKITYEAVGNVLERIAALEDRDEDSENDYFIDETSSSVNIKEIEQKLEQLKQVTMSLKSTNEAENVEEIVKVEVDEEQEEAMEGEVQQSETVEQEIQVVQASIDFQPLDEAIADVEQAISLLEEAEEDENSTEGLQQLIDKLYEQLEQLEQEAYEPLVERIIQLQEAIYYSDYKNEILSEEETEQLLAGFLQEDEVKTKTFESLLSYVNELEVFDRYLIRGSTIDEELIQHLLQAEDVEVEVEALIALYEVEEEIEKRINPLQKMFNRLLGKEENEEEGYKGLLDSIERNFQLLLHRTNKVMKEYDESIVHVHGEIADTLQQLEQRSDEVLESIQLTDENMFEWEQSTNGELTEGELVYQMHQGTMTSLDHLKSLVSTLNDQQENITEDTNTLHANIYEVQSESDDLNKRWAENVLTTEMIRNDVHNVLDNAIIDGQENYSVYDYLTNPVQVEERAGGKVLTEQEDRMPPVILLMIILVSGLLIGFITQYYSQNSYVLQAILFVLLNIGVGTLISIYGNNLYPLPESRAVLWTIFTIVLLTATSNVIRGGLFLNPFIGWLVSIGLIIFYTTPLLNIVVPEFQFFNPISNVYIGMLYRNDVEYGALLFVLCLFIVIVSALIYTLQMYRNKPKVAEGDEQEVS